MKLAILSVLGLLAIVGVNSDDSGCTATGMEPYDYGQALCMSFLFYEAQRSGALPSDQRVTWRHDSTLTDGSDVGLDLTGGYFDAGDYVKFGFPMAYSVTGLAWGLIAYPSGFSSTGQTDYGRAAVRWGAEYFLKAKTGSTEFYGQIGDPDLDHAYWGRPEEMTMDRPSYKIDASSPGSDLAGESAAALAAASIVFSDSDSSFASECLAAARDLFDFADQYRDVYQNSITVADGYYTSYSYEDELAWSALWMYKATGEDSYMDKAKEYIDEFGIMYYAVNMDWGSKQPGIYALMAELDGSQEYIDSLTSYVDSMINDQTYTPMGLLYLGEWGSLREATGVAFIAARAASLGINTDSYNAWAQTQADYALGSTGRSFVVGFGVDPPVNPHHASSSCGDPPEECGWDTYDSPDPNPQTLYGALVGGPDGTDSYTDDRSDYVHNEVACDYNALYTSLLAAMVEVH